MEFVHISAANGHTNRPHPFPDSLNLVHLQDCSASERSNSTLTSSATEPASSSHRAESESSSEPLPILCLGGLTSAAFALALEFIYTDRYKPAVVWNWLTA